MQERKGGPQTEEGRAVSSMNSLKHGLLSNRLLPGESRAKLEQFASGMWVELAPIGTLEAALAERAIWLLWRLRRVTRVEQALLEPEDEAVPTEMSVQWVEGSLPDGEATGGKAADPQQEAQRQERALATFGANAGLLSRYETSLEKSLYRTLGELRALQDVRKHNERQAVAKKPVEFVSQKRIPAKETSAR